MIRSATIDACLILFGFFMGIAATLLVQQVISTAKMTRDLFRRKP